MEICLFFVLCYKHATKWVPRNKSLCNRPSLVITSKGTFGIECKTIECLHLELNTVSTVAFVVYCSLDM